MSVIRLDFHSARRMGVTGFMSDAVVACANNLVGVYVSVATAFSDWNSASD